ncbi:MAG: MgtC/SapB family protein [Gemmatimonadota bacterium]
MDGFLEFLRSLPPVLEVPTLLRLLLALVLGAAIGLEREVSGKPAGLRTIILICVGAELLTEASLLAANFTIHDLVRADPARIAAQIVTGIGFIGAGTILVHRATVVGLTTAATLWVAAAIGMTVGLRAYVIAVGATILVLLALVTLRWIERALPDSTTDTLHVTLVGADCGPDCAERMLEELGFDLDRLGMERRESEVTYRYTIRGRRTDREELVKRLSRMELVRCVNID